MKTLILGAGKRGTILRPVGELNSNRLNLVSAPLPENSVTLDMCEDHDPDVLWNLNSRPLPFDDNSFDEIHAYEVLEHVGTQGDFVSFFEEFGEYWRILKPGGVLTATVPMWNSVWAWADPGHTRVIAPQLLVFLSQGEYERQVGVTRMTDYRFIWDKDFALLSAAEIGDGILYFQLEAKK